MRIEFSPDIFMLFFFYISLSNVKSKVSGLEFVGMNELI